MLRLNPSLRKLSRKITRSTVLDPILHTFLDVAKSTIDCRNQFADQNGASMNFFDSNDVCRYMKAMLPYQSIIFMKDCFRMHLFVLGVIRDTVVFFGFADVTVDCCKALDLSDIEFKDKKQMLCI